MIALGGAAVALATGSGGSSPVRGVGGYAPVPSIGGCPAAGDAHFNPSGLSIAVSPDPAAAGAPVTISGHLLGLRPGVRRCGIAVVLWRQLAGQQGFGLVARSRTDSAGRFQIVVSPGTVETNREWFATTPRLRSATVSERVHAIVSLTTTARFAVSGDHLTLSGQVVPGHPGQRVLLQRRAGGDWQTIVRPRLDRNSSFSVNHLFTVTGAAQWRALLPRDRRNVQSQSAPVNITIAPDTGIHKIKHVVIIMQENRSFDSYFGTYPGADGIPSGRLRAGSSERRVRGPLPRLLRPELRRSARRLQRGCRHRRRQDGRVRRRGPAGAGLYDAPTRTAARASRPARASAST